MCAKLTEAKHLLTLAPLQFIKLSYMHTYIHTCVLNLLKPSTCWCWLPCSSYSYPTYTHTYMCAKLTEDKHLLKFAPLQFIKLSYIHTYTHTYMCTKLTEAKRLLKFAPLQFIQLSYIHTYIHTHIHTCVLNLLKPSICWSLPLCSSYSYPTYTYTYMCAKLTEAKHLLKFAPLQFIQLSEDEPGGHRYSPKAQVALHCHVLVCMYVCILNVYRYMYTQGARSFVLIYMYVCVYSLNTWKRDNLLYYTSKNKCAILDDFEYMKINIHLWGMWVWIVM
jgi:hypothetical protein